MQAHIITIGDELLIGQVVDTNSVFIAKELSKIGVQVREISSIEDDRDAIINILNYAKKKSDIIILTGGLGPTKDDITKRTLTDYFKDHLVFHQASFDNLKRIFDAKGNEISLINRVQAELPSKAIVLINLFGTASGMYFQEENKHIFSLPGVPFEMKSLITQKVIPILKNRFNLPYFINQTIITQKIGESFLSEKIESWESNLPSYLALAYLPSAARVRLRLSGRHKNREVLTQEVGRQIELLKKIIPQYILSTKGEELEKVIGEKLLSRKWTLATAESCTGGKIASKITSVPGSSSYYKGSIISYATEIKETVLKISKLLIDKETVVSEKVAILMAQNAKKMLNTSVGIATTGVAGPGTGEDQHEVGIAFIAVVTPEKTRVRKYNFPTVEREQFIEKLSNTALQLAYDMMV